MDLKVQIKCVNFNEHCYSILCVKSRKHVKGNRSKLVRDNIKLKEQLETIDKRCENFKKRYNSEKWKISEIENGSQANQQKNEILRNAIKKHYENVKNRKNECAFGNYISDVDNQWGY